MTITISDNNHYSAWKRQVDNICKSAFSGMDAACLPDFGWKMCYSSGVQPLEAVNEAINYWCEDTTDLVEAWNSFVSKEFAHG